MCRCNFCLIKAFARFPPVVFSIANIALVFACVSCIAYMMKITTYTPSREPIEHEFAEINEFLYNHLEQYGDAKTDIAKAMEYSLGRNNTAGGFMLTAKDEADNITGAVVVNNTGMNGYIPGHILVYIATHNEHRGKGIGKVLMQAAIEAANGDMALHVEPDNPAKMLYEKLGFTNKYLEMRLTNNK